MNLIRDIFDWGKIRNKFLLATLAIGIIPILTLGIVFYVVSERNIFQTSQKLYADNLSIVNSFINILTKDVEDNSRMVLGNQTVTSLIKANDVKKGANYLDARVTQTLDHTVRQIFYDTADLSGVFLFGSQNFKYQYTPYGISPMSLNEIDIGSMSGQDWYQATVNANGKECFFLFNVMADYYGGEPLSSFSTTKLLRDITTGEPYGLLVVNMSREYYDRVYPAAMRAESSSCYMLMDAKSAKVGYVGMRVGTVEKLDDFLSFFPDRKPDSSKHIFATRRNARTGWDLIHVTTRSALFLNSGALPLTILIALIIIICLSVLVSVFAANTISRPLTRLNAAIKEVEEKGFSTVNDFGKGEVGAIGNHFDKMAKRNEQLNKRLIKLSVLEKEAELNALQAQINPHFLYNTLSAMYWLAKFGKTEDVAQMAESLSDIFRMVLNKGKDIITIAEEVNHVKKYIDIQNIRYNNRIQVLWDIDSDLMDKKILKLILQPLVENAIYHGLEPHLGDWRLILKGYTESGDIIFIVQDNGVGMNVAESTAHGFGINNVTERIRLKYGEQYECKFISEVGAGTTVEVRIPYVE